jgi:hypothetical protein
MEAMRVQTYALWVHQPALPWNTRTAGQPLDDLSGFIDDLIARVAYYPSLMVQMSLDAQGFLLAGAQRVLQADEQLDGMVVLRTVGGNVWVTQAAYDRLVA